MSLYQSNKFSLYSLLIVLPYWRESMCSPKTAHYDFVDCQTEYGLLRRRFTRLWHSSELLFNNTKFSFEVATRLELLWASTAPIVRIFQTTKPFNLPMASAVSRTSNPRLAYIMLWIFFNCFWWNDLNWEYGTFGITRAWSSEVPQHYFWSLSVV